MCSLLSSPPSIDQDPEVYTMLAGGPKRGGSNTRIFPPMLDGPPPSRCIASACRKLSAVVDLEAVPRAHVRIRSLLPHTSTAVSSYPSSTAGLRRDWMAAARTTSTRPTGPIFGVEDAGHMTFEVSTGRASSRWLWYSGSSDDLHPLSRSVPAVTNAHTHRGRQQRNESRRSSGSA